MTLGQLAYFLAVVEERSFTRAAQRLLVSQPALSHQIGSLERSAGGALLERPPRAVRPTALGERLLPHARAAVAAADAATAAARAVGRLEAGDLRVGALLSVALGIVPPAIRAWRADHPGVRVEVLEFVHNDALAAAVADGVADLGVGTAPPGWRGTTHAIGTEELVLVLPMDDPLLREGTVAVALERLAGRPWVLYDPDFGLAPIVAEAFAQAGIAPRAAVRVHHTATAVELAASGLGPALVPGNVVGPDVAAAVVRPDRPVTRELVAFVRDAPSPPAAAFIDALAEHATPLGPPGAP
jgi:DNA-binding transcriptional LysR family regulator